VSEGLLVNLCRIMSDSLSAGAVQVASYGRARSSACDLRFSLVEERTASRLKSSLQGDGHSTLRDPSTSLRDLRCAMGRERSSLGVR
jgi:hypothetical protein